MPNIHYRSSEIADFYEKNRIEWNHLYDSEKRAFDYLKPNQETSVLDIGCATAGLFGILHRRYGVVDYVGVEINLEAAKRASRISSDIEIFPGDFLDVTKKYLGDRKFDLVVSLSTFDWNIEFYEMLEKGWDRVQPGGSLCMNARLVNSQGMTNIDESFQYISFKGEKTFEIAPYIIFNAKDFFSILEKLNPSSIYMHGYWGKPNLSTRTTVPEICFATVVLGKRRTGLDSRLERILELPHDLQVT